MSWEFIIFLRHCSGSWSGDRGGCQDDVRGWRASTQVFLRCSRLGRDMQGKENMETFDIRSGKNRLHSTENLIQNGMEWEKNCWACFTETIGTTDTIQKGESQDKRNASAGVLHRLRFSRKNPLCKFKFKTFTLERRGEWFYAALQSFCVIKKIFLIKIKTWLHTFLTKLIDIFWNYWYIECQIVSCYDT